jgi:serine/threonine protein kinase
MERVEVNVRDLNQFQELCGLQIIADCHAQKVVHGDMKPENIMISGDKTIVTLVDFGTASLCEGVGPTAYHF